MRQLRHQRPHEGEHHELAGHLQRRDQQQPNDHPVTPDSGPGLESHRRADHAARQAPRQQQKTESADRADAAIHRAPAVTAGDEGDQRQTDRRGQRPAEKYIGDGAAALLDGYNESRGARGLRRI